MTETSPLDTRSTRRVIRWCDDWQEMSLADELRSRPYRWAVVAERVTAGVEMDNVIRGLGLMDDEGFEKDARPVDDGPYGVIYEVVARYVPTETSVEPPP